MLVPTEHLRTRKVVSFEELSVGAAAVALANASSLYYDWCEIEIEGQPIRFRLDGTNPTSSVGHFCGPGSFHVLSPNETQGLRAIRTGAANGTVRAMYYVRA